MHEVQEIVEVAPTLKCPNCGSWNCTLEIEFNIIFKKQAYFILCGDCETTGYRYLDAEKALYDFEHFHGLPKKKS